MGATTLSPRPALAENITYYVDATNGSDGNGNDGLTADSAWATLQHAWDRIANGYDCNGYQVFIQCADGTYEGFRSFKSYDDYTMVYPINLTRMTVLGNADDNTAVIIGKEPLISNEIVSMYDSNPMHLDFKDVTFDLGNTSTAGIDTVIEMAIKNCRVINGSTAQFLAVQRAYVNFATALEIVGNVGTFMSAEDGARIDMGIPITVTGATAWGTTFAHAYTHGYIRMTGVTWAGTSPTGKTFVVDSGGIIASSDLIHGNVAGTADTGGIASASIVIPPVIPTGTVAALPSAATAGAGARGFVTDASATTFHSTVAGSGANKVPVVSDGTNWLIG